MLTGGKFGKHLQRLSTQWVYSALQLGNLLGEQSVAELHSENIGRLGELIYFQGRAAFQPFLKLAHRCRIPRVGGGGGGGWGGGGGGRGAAGA